LLQVPDNKGYPAWFPAGKPIAAFSRPFSAGSTLGNSLRTGLTIAATYIRKAASHQKKMAPKTGPFLLHFVMMMAMTVMKNHQAFRMSAVPAALAAITVT
jgi:hypothetical protein